MKSILPLIAALQLAPLAVLSAADAPAQRPNILFIIADDASPHFGQAYGCKWVKTPNIDRLARNGLVFDNADSQVHPVALGHPDRAKSMATGGCRESPVAIPRKVQGIQRGAWAGWHLRRRWRKDLGSGIRADG